MAPDRGESWRFRSDLALNRATLAKDHPQPDQYLEEKRAGAIGHHIDERAGAVGQKGLMKFIRAGDEESPKHGQAVDCNRHAGWIVSAPRHPEGAKPGNGLKSVSHKMAALADDHVQTPPLGLREVFVEQELEKVLQWAGRVISAEPGCGLDGDDADAEDDRNPCAGPMPEAIPGGDGAGSGWGHATGHAGYSTW